MDVWQFLKELNIELPYELAIPLIGIYQIENRCIQKICTQMFTAALFIAAKR